MKIPGLIRKRGWYYWRPPQMGGVESKRVALHTKDEQAAVKAVWDLQSNGRVLRVGTGTVEGLLDRYLATKRDQRKQNAKSADSTRKVLKSFAAWAGNPAVAKIDREMVERWRAGNPDLADASITSYLQRLRGFLTWCTDAGLIVRHPMRGMRLPRPKSTRINSFLTIQERDRLLAVPVSKEMRLILHLGFYAGLRPGEILAMRADWIQGNRIVVQEVKVDGKIVFRPKDKEARAIPLHPELAAVLEDYKGAKGWLVAPHKKDVPTPPKLRYDPKKAFAAAAKAAKVKATPYTLRHSFGAHLIQGGATLADVASLLGDSLSVTQDHYAGLTKNAHDIILRLGTPKPAPSARDAKRRPRLRATNKMRHGRESSETA